ncbi:hypothetical protein [Fibrella arboris]|uniref:hypothetical protein n=1 Tax=Fibrella arboris TaxID=3242486 RepID=UPI0035217CCD
MNRSDDLFPQPGGTPDPYWQRAFDDAFDTPPPRVWEGVERQLDLDESDGILPLWQHRQGRQSMLFGRWAAGIAASLLLTALGWWAWHREDAIRPDAVVAHTATKSKSDRSALARAEAAAPMAEATKVHSQPVPRLADAPILAQQMERTQDARYRATAHGRTRYGFAGPTAKPAMAMHMASTRATSALAPGTLPAAARSADQSGLSQAAANQLVDPNLGQTETINGTLVFSETTLSSTVRLKQDQTFRAKMGDGQPAIMSRSVVTHSMTMQSFSGSGQSLNTPASSSFSEMPTGGSTPGSRASSLGQDRSVTSMSEELPKQVAMTGAPLASQSLAARTQPASTNKPTAEPMTPASNKRTQRPWLSAGVTALSFNPAVAVRSAFSPVASASQRFASLAGSVASTPVLQSQVGHAVAFQAGVGVPLGEHWSIESGVGYLRGQNDIQSPVRIASVTSNLKAANTDNLYADLVTRLSNQSLATANYAADKQYDYVANQSSNYTASQQQVVSNTYQFVQVPVQVGYELRPRRKFGLALLTGMVSNWFVKNTVAETITIKPGDGVYRPVTLAGTAGMRLRYRPDNLWSASVAGMYQQSLQSLTTNDVSVQAQPQQVGLSFSVDRHF